MVGLIRVKRGGEGPSEIPEIVDDPIPAPDPDDNIDPGDDVPPQSPTFPDNPIDLTDAEFINPEEDLVIIIDDPDDGGPAPPVEPDPDPVEVPNFTHSNLSGDYQNFSNPSNLVSIRDLTSGDYWIKDPSGAVADLLVGNRGSGGGAVMDNFMWDNREDAFLWIVGLELQRRRSSDNTVADTVALPATVDGRSVTWRAGHRGGRIDDGGLWVWAYDQPNDASFIVRVDTNPFEAKLDEGFWISDAMGGLDTHFHNMFQKSNGFAFEPQSSVRQAWLYEYQQANGGTADRLETEITADDWAHPTWSHSHLAFWSNPNGRIEIHDASGLLADPKDTDIDEGSLVATISVGRVAAAYGAGDGDYVQYQHGHLVDGRLCFSVYNSRTNKFGVMIYVIQTDQLIVAAAEFEAGLDFADQPRPSMSIDGRMICYLTASGVQIRPVTIPDAPGPDPDPEVDPPEDPGQAEPPATTNPWPDTSRPPIMHWDYSMIPPSSWNNWIDGPLVGNDSSTGRPKPQSNSLRYPGNIAAGQIALVANDEVPRMNSDGSLACKTFSGAFNSHNMVRPWASGILDHATWLRARKLYRFDLEFDLVDNVGWSDPSGDSIRWAIPMQLWGEYPGKWRNSPVETRPPGRLSPVFAVQLAVESPGFLQWQLITRGTSSIDPLKPWEHEDTTTVTASLGRQRVTVWWKKDHTGVDSYVRVDINGVMRKELSNVKLGTPFLAGGKTTSNVNDSQGGQPSMGIYTPREFAAPGVEVNWRLIRLYVLS